MTFLNPAPSDDGEALLHERGALAREIRDVTNRIKRMRLPWAEPNMTKTERRATLDGLRTYREMLEGRLTQVVANQHALCGHCLGTGIEPDPDILRATCLACGRVNYHIAKERRFFNTM